MSLNNLVAGAEATDTLMRGFTIVRGMGGPAFGLKRVIDSGIAVGPRIYHPAPMTTVTSGRVDCGQLFELSRTIGGPPALQGDDEG
jgi:imidazolonepropionase-like amidohydrolase